MAVKRRVGKLLESAKTTANIYGDPAVLKKKGLLEPKSEFGKAADEVYKNLEKNLKEVKHERPAGQPFEVSQSTIKTWRRCRRKYAYRFVDLLELRKPKLTLIRGTMVGKCLDALTVQRMKSPPKILQVFVKDWRKALDPFRKEYGRMFQEEQEMYGDPIGDVERIVERYQRVYANDGLHYPILNPNGEPYELPVQVDLAPGIVFAGHMDKLPQDKQGRYWDLDHKTHRSIPGPDDRFHDLQQVFYMWAAEPSGYPKLSGVIWDYIRTKPPTVPEQLKKGGVTQRQNIDTDFETYMGELKRLGLDPMSYHEILNKLKVRGHMDFFQRIQLPTPNPQMVKTIVEEARSTALEIKEKGGHDRSRTMDRTCKQCEYNSICNAELRGMDADFIRKTEYQKQKDPRHIHLMEEDI